MATATMATAAGAAALLYYTLNRKVQADNSDDEGYESDQLLSSSHAPSGSDRIPQRLIQAPATWLETISTLSETLKFTYSETLGKWPIGDLAFGISFLLKRQGNVHVSDVFGGKDSLQLKGSDIAANLTYLLYLLTLCWHFSKKPFPLFLKETGYSEENVLLQEPKAGILKPAFTILADHSEKCFLLLIRGTHSIKDTLTAVTGAVVPFHHSVVNEGGVSDVVLGYAHCGMVAAARWIAKLATPVLLEALKLHPDYKLKIVGHSLGGGTAALLTYVLREQKELSTATCVAFAPAACMTWELAESGNDFITCVINGADLVPTFSAASIDDLRAEVTASAWLNDLRNQIERTRILGTVYRSASALGSRLPSISTAKAKVAGAGALLRPVSNRTQVVMKRAQSMAHAAWSRPTLGLSSWSCIGPRRRAAATSRSNTKDGDKEESKEDEEDRVSNSTDSSSPTKEATTTSNSIDDEDDPLLTRQSVMRSSVSEAIELPISSREEWSSEIEQQCSCSDRNDLDRLEDRMTEVELWQQLEQELCDRTRMEGEEEDDDEDEDVVKEMREEEAAAIAEAGEASSSSAPQTKESHRFFPPGRIMHIVTLPFESHDSSEEDEGSDNNSSDTEEEEERSSGEAKVAIFLTQRSLYSKIRLSQSMINDHFMPVYRRQIEKLIKGMEKQESDSSSDYDSSLRAKTREVLL